MCCNIDYDNAIVLKCFLIKYFFLVFSEFLTLISTFNGGRIK